MVRCRRVMTSWMRPCAAAGVRHICCWWCRSKMGRWVLKSVRWWSSATPKPTHEQIERMQWVTRKQKTKSGVASVLFLRHLLHP